MHSSLDELQKVSQFIGEIRGLGPMIGVEIVNDKKTKEPSKEKTNKIISLAKSKGLLLVSCGLEENVIRFMGPLTTPLEQVEEAMEIFSNSVKDI